MSTLFDNNAFKEIAANWDHSHKYSPAPRHRRRITMDILKSIRFDDCLDAGCAQPYLLEEITHLFKVKGYGCDISSMVIESNKSRLPSCDFEVIDLAKNAWPNDKKFDLVVSSEVIEHIPDWHGAVKNLAKMSKKYLFITVPGGKLRPIDHKLGHHRHYRGDELKAEIEKHGFKCTVFRKHGFPMHSIYKRLINFIAPDKIYDSFSGGKEYSFFQKLFCQILYYTFYVNHFFNRGDQLFILAERKIKYE